MAKTKRPIKKEEVQEVKVQRKKEEVFATAVSFLFMGAYVMITGNVPDTLMGWVKFVGMFVLILAVVYVIAIAIVRMKKSTKSTQR